MSGGEYWSFQKLVLAAGIALISTPAVRGQQAVPSPVRYERILCIVPMVGSGTWEDPRRPMFVPSPREKRQRASLLRLAPRRERISGLRTEILSYHYELSDDGRYALVEFRARSPRAFERILAHRGPGVKVFRPGRDRRERVEAEFRKYKRRFDWRRFSGR